MSALLVKADQDPLHGDILEEILSHVPLIDLIPALQVSTAWNRPVHSSLIHRSPPKPCLILHSQSTRHPYATSTRAYDPRSRAWMKIHRHLQPSFKSASFIKSSHSSFLYAFGPTKLRLSFDALNLTCSELAQPMIWREDPIVAKVGDSIIVAGGGCDYGEDDLPVEIYDTKTRTRIRIESPTPAGLKDTAASTWLSIAATDEKLFVMEKQSGTTHCFDLKYNRWSPPRDLRFDPRCFYSVIGCANGRLIVVGLIGAVERLEKVKMWEVGIESFEEFREITELPSVFLEKLNSETFGVGSVNICVGGSSVYIYNPEEVVEVVVCEIVKGGACVWGSVDCAVAGGGAWIMERLVFTCADVQLEELEKWLKFNSGRKFEYVNV